MPFSGALEEGTLAARPLGHVARQVAGANELWLALALTAEPVQQLPPPQLAAALSGLIAPDVRLFLCLLPQVAFNAHHPRCTAASALSLASKQHNTIDAV